MAFAQNCTEKYYRNVAIQEAFVHFIHLKILLIIVVQTDKCPLCVCSSLSPVADWDY